MTKKIGYTLLLLIALISITACGNNNKKLNEIVEKINKSETVKNYKESGYELKASSTGNTLSITTNTDGTKRKVSFTLDGDIISNENLTYENLMEAMILLNGIGKTYGYKEGELTQCMNAFPDQIENYTLEKEGLEWIMDDEKISLKVDLSKKIPLIDMDQYYLSTDSLDMIKEYMSEKNYGNQSGRIGNIAYDVFVNEDENTITIGQVEKLSDSAYKSILSALEVMYGKETSNHFQEIYPKFVDEKTTIEAFTIETNYKIEDQEDSMFQGTKVVQVTIDNHKVK